MPRSLWLADILADEFRGDPGFQFDVVPGWQTRGSSSANHAGVMEHHTGPGSYIPLLNYMAHNAKYAPLTNVANSRPLNGIVRVTVVAAGRANHAGVGQLPWAGYRSGGNTGTIGNEGQNNGYQLWPDQQLEAQARIDAALLAYMNRDVSRLLDHKTYAPGRKIDRHTIILKHWRTRVDELMNPSERPIVATGSIVGENAFGTNFMLNRTVYTDQREGIVYLAARGTDESDWVGGMKAPVLLVNPRDDNVPAETLEAVRYFRPAKVIRLGGQVTEAARDRCAEEAAK